MRKVHVQIAVSAALYVAGIAALPCALNAQQPCSITVSLRVPTRSHMFNPDQERLLGDIEAESVESNYPAVHDVQLAAHLQSIADRVLSQFPGVRPPVRIILVDTPEADSFSTGPERIYVTRKMIALIKNDDELAGLLGHELAHIVMHQNATTVSELFREILGVNSVSDRKDIADRLAQLFDALDHDARLLRKAAQVIGKQEAAHQYEADRVALYASAAAGFSPQAFVDLFSRFAGTDRSTGDFLSDFVRLTTSNEMRLRQVNRSLRQLPQPCRNLVPGYSNEFGTWQAAVGSYHHPEGNALTSVGEK
jgi:predicted Zn-dependent protease